MIVTSERLRASTRHARIDVARMVPAALLAGYGVFILSLFVRNVLSWYINPVYIGPTVLAAAVLVGLGALGVASHEAHDHDAIHTHGDACDDDGCGCADGCGCGETTKYRWGTYAMLTLPLVLGAVFPPTSLAAFSANQRGPQIAGLSLVHSSLPVRHVTLGVDTRTFSMEDWVGALSADPNPRDYMHKPVIVSGLVVHSAASVPTGYLMVIRYLVTCCIADARPVGLVVRDTSHGALKDNQWVTVTGTMGAASFGGQQIAVVLPTSMVPTRSQDPYIY